MDLSSKRQMKNKRHLVVDDENAAAAAACKELLLADFEEMEAESQQPEQLTPPLYMSDDDDFTDEDLREIQMKLDSVEILKPIIKTADMKINREYKIVAARKASTKYGMKTVLELEDYQLFLPSKYSTLDDKVIKSLNSSIYNVKNLGKNGNSYKFNFVLRKNDGK